MKILLITIFASLVFVQCPSQNADKELELKQRELALKEKEMEMNSSDGNTAKDDAESKNNSETEKKAEDKKAADNEKEENKPALTAKPEDADNSGSTAIKFDKGKTSKSVSVSLKQGEAKRFTIDVGKGQVINVTIPKNVEMSATLNLINGRDGVDKWQDGFGYLSILAGRQGVYVIEVVGTGGKNVSFPMKVAVTSNPDDYEGGL